MPIIMHSLYPRGKFFPGAARSLRPAFFGVALADGCFSPSFHGAVFGGKTGESSRGFTPLDRDMPELFEAIP